MAMSPTAGRAARRWYAHGWNRPVSWELILGVTPHLPRVILAPLHHLMTTICFACMRREREAVRRNLGRVTGAGGPASRWLAYRLFLNFSRFLVGYTEMRRFDMDRFRSRLSGAEEAEAALREALRDGNGVILLSMHMGHWDLGLKMLSHFNLPVHVVMLSEDAEEVTRYADEARAVPNLRVHQSGSSPLLAVELMTALKRGELVAIQADRPVGSNVMSVPFFGADADLPTGPAQLAMATSAPVLPICVLLDGPGRYRLLSLPPMRFARNRRDVEGALRTAMIQIAETMESVIARHPDQWFNFYDVWPAGDGHVHHA